MSFSLKVCLAVYTATLGSYLFLRFATWQGPAHPIATAAFLFFMASVGFAVYAGWQALVELRGNSHRKSSYLALLGSVCYVVGYAAYMHQQWENMQP